MRLSITLPIDRWEPCRGGAERYLDACCRSLGARGHRVTVLCLIDRAPRPLPDGLAVEVLPVPWRPRWRRELEFARRSLAAHRDSGRDLLFAVRHPLEADVYQPHGGCFRAARVGVHAHLSPVMRGWRRALAALRPTTHVLLWLDAQVFRRSPRATVVAISGKVEEEIRAAYPAASCTWRRLYHGVDTTRLHDGDRAERTDALRARWGGSGGERIAVFLAHRFAPKGLREALHALARAPSWHLVVCGRDRPGRFRRLARSLGLAARVHFAGEIGDSRTVLAGADALLLPTHHDACSLVVLEALSCGTPVVTTRQSGSGELVTPGREGFVLDSPRRVEELAAALQAIEHDWDRFHTAALALRERIGWEHHVDELEAVLLDAARRATGSPG